MVDKINKCAAYVRVFSYNLLTVLIVFLYCTNSACGASLKLSWSFEKVKEKIETMEKCQWEGTGNIISCTVPKMVGSVDLLKEENSEDFSMEVTGIFFDSPRDQSTEDMSKNTIYRIFDYMFDDWEVQRKALSRAFEDAGKSEYETTINFGDILAKFERVEPAGVEETYIIISLIKNER